jgi:ligand-binding sensor domain-containing protein
MVLSSSVVFGQQGEKPEKPTLNNATERGYELNNIGESNVLMPVQSSTELSNEMGYWSHLITQNTGQLPFGESLFYAYPRYWNYVFVDSNNRLFTDAGGLFVWNGAYWREVTANGQQISRVREIVEDNNGNLWLGTVDGLIELNSSLQFVERYTTSNSNLKKNDINTLWIEDDGSLWIGHRWDENTGGGVTIFNEEVIEGLEAYTNDIIQRSNGDVWVAQAPDEQGNGGSIYVYRPSNDSSWTYTEENSGLPHSEVDNFSEDSQGNIWMGHYATAHHPMGGVTKFDGTDWIHFDQDDGLPQGGAWFTYAASDDRVYYTTRDSIMTYENDSWSHFTNGNDRFPLIGAAIVTEDKDNNLIIGASPGADLTGGGIQIYDGSNWEFLSNHTDGGLFSNVIFGADVDTEGNLWFSGFYGAAMYDGENWTYFSENDGMSNTYAWKLLAASDGSIWFGESQMGAVTRYQDGEFIVYEDYVGFEEIIFEDSEGNIWLGAWDWKNKNKEGGILKYDGSSFTVFDDSDGLIGENVTAIGEGPDGNIYASTFAGVAVFDGSSWSEFTVDGQTGVGANELAPDADNNLWIDTDGAIKKWDGSNWTTFDESDGYMGRTTHIEPAPDGSIWMAGAKIQVIRDNMLVDLTPNAEYPGTTSYVITHDDDGATWVGTYGNGLFKYEMSQGLTIESVSDYPDDQGQRVTVEAAGFLMDPYQITDNDYKPTSWGVEIKNGDVWESLRTDGSFSTNPNQISVDLPTTMPTDEDLDEHKYNLRLAIYKDGETLGYSESATAYALDNLAPSAVNGVAANRGSNGVALSWDPVLDNDIKQYEVVSADEPEGSPLTTTLSTGVELSDDQYEGIQQLLVRARDRHENVGDASNPVLVVFPMNLTYQAQDDDEWMLIGLPLDATSEDISNLQSQIKEGTLYEFNGSYQSSQELEPGKGYWAKFSSSGDYSVPGLPVVEQTLDLDKGWNLISGVGADLEYSNIQDPDGILIDGTLSGFDGSYTQSDVLYPGNGYWIRASEVGTVSLSLSSDGESTMQQKNKKPALAKAKEKLNKISIQTDKGAEQTLYFGKELPDNINPLSFSLPPQAPGNTFDVRFAGDTRFDEAGDELNISFQAGQASSVTVDLDLLATHPHQQYVLQERKSNKVLAEHPLTAENNVILTNSDITNLTIQSKGLSERQADMPDEFDLSPSYPNPFNPSTTIQYQLPQQETVSLEVFDMAGRKVRTLIAGEQQKVGTHTMRFDASNLSSGVYFVRIQAGTFQDIQKITLIK